MESNNLFYIIIAILVLQFLIETVLDHLNSQKFQDPVPEELNDVFDQSEYVKSQDYKRINHRFGVLTSSFFLMLTLSFLIFGGFEWIDSMARAVTDNAILVALLFFGIIMIGSDVVSTPFSYYHTFVIEEKFGFNQTSKNCSFWINLRDGP